LKPGWPRRLIDKLLLAARAAYQISPAMMHSASRRFGASKGFSNPHKPKTILCGPAAQALTKKARGG
jgi:hypothetical protein